MANGSADKSPARLRLEIIKKRSAELSDTDIEFIENSEHKLQASRDLLRASFKRLIHGQEQKSGS